MTPQQAQQVLLVPRFGDEQCIEARNVLRLREEVRQGWPWCWKAIGEYRWRHDYDVDCMEAFDLAWELDYLRRAGYKGQP